MQDARTKPGAGDYKIVRADCTPSNGGLMLASFDAGTTFQKSPVYTQKSPAYTQKSTQRTEESTTCPQKSTAPPKKSP